MYTYYTQDHKILSDTITYYLYSEDSSIRELCSILEAFLEHAKHIVEHGIVLLIPESNKSLDKLIKFESNLIKGTDAAALASQCIIHAVKFMDFMKEKGKKIEH